MGSSATISIVDDSTAAREGLADLVETLGFGAAAFAGAEEFLKSEHPGLTSCLIVDMHMPGMTGLELYDRLVAFGYAIPSVLITGFSDESVRERAIRAGFVCCLIKPFTEQALVGCIRRALRRRDESRCIPATR